MILDQVFQSEEALDSARDRVERFLELRKTELQRDDSFQKMIGYHGIN